jgi:hypothetical protein
MGEEADADATAFRESALTTTVRESALMDETSDYSARGRRFRNMSSEQLNDAWGRAFLTWFSRRDDTRDMDDCDAEMRLRQVEPPCRGVGPVPVGGRSRGVGTIAASCVS